MELGPSLSSLVLLSKGGISFIFLIFLYMPIQKTDQRLVILEIVSVILSNILSAKSYSALTFTRNVMNAFGILNGCYLFPLLFSSISAFQSIKDDESKKSLILFTRDRLYLSCLRLEQTEHLHVSLFPIAVICCGLLKKH